MPTGPTLDMRYPPDLRGGLATGWYSNSALERDNLRSVLGCDRAAAPPALALRHNALHVALLHFHARPGRRDRRRRWLWLCRRMAQQQYGLIMGHGTVIRMPA